MAAWFSEGGEPAAIFRWRLDRNISAEGLVVALVGVNPSTAGSEKNDPTIRKDIGFAKRLGWRRIIKVNKFAFRATDVGELRDCLDFRHGTNDLWLRMAFDDADLIMPCWGPLSKLPTKLRNRWIEVRKIMQDSGKPIMCLGEAGDNQPRHTLMLPYETALRPWVLA